MTPEVYEKHETSRKTRNPTKNPKPHEKPETPRKTRNPTKNPKLYGKHKLHGKPKILVTLKFIKNMTPHVKPELHGDPEISWQKRVYPEKVFQSFSEFSVLV